MVILDALLRQTRLSQEGDECVQQRVVRFGEDNRHLLKNYNRAVTSSPGWAAPFQRFVTDPQREELDLLAGLSHSDTAGVTSARLVLTVRQPDKHLKVETTYSISQR